MISNEENNDKNSKSSDILNQVDDENKKKQDANSSDDQLPKQQNDQNKTFNTQNGQKLSIDQKNDSLQPQKKYRDILNDQSYRPRQKSELIEQMKGHGILYKQQLDVKIPKTFNGQMSSNNEQQDNPLLSYGLNITKMTHTINYEIVTLTVQLGPYQLQLTILNVFKQSFVYRLVPLTFQDSTNIYLIKHKGQQQICKLIMYTDYGRGQVQSDLRKQEIVHSIREFCISKIMSALKIGPKVLKSCYFDLIVSDSGMEFYIQKCLGHAEKGFTNQDEATLKTNLKQMHALGFLHRDIKPANIMYSLQYNKFVLIDFGISEYRRQQPGQLIKSKFLGTVMYCTQEMRKLLNQRSSAWIDVHYNDAYGLELSVREMHTATLSHSHLIVKSKEKFYSQNLQEFSSAFNQQSASVSITNTLACNEIIFQPQLLEREIKHRLYNNELQQLMSLTNNTGINIKNRPLNFQRRILNFLYQIPATQSIRRFYLLQFNQQIKSERQFVKLWQCFKTPVYIESYKGQRQFLSFQQKKSSQLFTKIYSKIKAKYHNRMKNNKIVKREYEKLLKNCDFKKQNEGQGQIFQGNKMIQQSQYQRLLIQYVSFKNIEWQSSLKQKAYFCMIYAKFLNLNDYRNYEEGDQRGLIQNVLYRIAIIFSNKSTPSNNLWPTLISCIENYFIVGEKMPFNLTQFLKLFLHPVLVDQQLTNLQKISRALDLLNTRKYLLRRYKKLSQYFSSYQLQDLVYQKLNQFIQDEKLNNQNKNFEMLDFFKQTFGLYKIQQSQDFYPYAIKNLNNMMYLRQKNLQYKKNFDLVEFQIGVLFQRNDRLEEGRKIYEQKKHDIVINQQELNQMHFQMVLVYEQTLEIKKIKKYLKIIDAAINCPEISDEYFIRLRIFLALYFHQYTYADTLLKRYKSLSIENMDQFLCINNYNWATKMNAFANLKYIKFSDNFWNFFQWTQNSVLKCTAKYQKSKNPIKFRNSNHLLYLQLLQCCIQIESKLIFSEFRNGRNKQWCPYNQKLCQSKYFKKAITVRSFQNLNLHDEVYLIYNELYLLKDKEQYDLMIQYLIQKQQVINKILCLTSRFQKSLLNQALTLVISTINKHSTRDKLSELMAIIIPILGHPRMGWIFFVEDFQHKIIEGLIKTDNFDFIITKIVQATKFYSRHVSNSNISTICRFYNNVASVVLFYYKEQQIVKRLKNVINQLDPRENPFFGMFLLFFIFPCNRLKIINYLYKCLDYINHTGKWIILSRLYKQIGKLKYVTRQRRRNLIKKDLIYPSRYTLNLLDIKGRLNTNGELNKFQGVFLQTLQNKLIKLGKCCQIYNEIQVQNKINSIFNHIELDLPLRQHSYQKWQREMW